jgi:hypothetical protein
MRTLPILGVCGRLVAAVALLSAFELIAGGLAQAQQFDPPEKCRLNLLQQAPLDLVQKQLDLFQKELVFRGCEGFVSGVEQPAPPMSSPPMSDWLNSSSWLISVADYRNEQQAPGQIRFQRSLLFSVDDIQRPSLGKGDYWRPGEFESLIAPR